MKEVAHLIRHHFEGILSWVSTRQTNGFLEAINGLFQAAKRKARGYQRFRTIRTVIFLIGRKTRLLQAQPAHRTTHLEFNRATIYMQAALEQLRAEGFPVLEADIPQLNPHGHQHINMLGRYSVRCPRISHPWRTSRPQKPHQRFGVG
jgi:hypothetical protein